METKLEVTGGRKGDEQWPSWRPRIGVALNGPDVNEYARAFRRDGYTVARGLFDPLTLEIFATYIRMLHANKILFPRADSPGHYDLYGNLLTESILVHLQPAMEQATGLSLLPTYSFLRLYETGAVLEKHTDRDACEISATLTLGYDAPGPWLLWIESNGEQKPINLAQGDMLIYRGPDIPHWREEFVGRYWVQAFFHYVDADGQLTAHRYDKRPGIGTRHK